MPVWQQMQKHAGEAVVLYSIIGCYDVDYLHLVSLVSTFNLILMEKGNCSRRRMKIKKIYYDIGNKPLAKKLKNRNNRIGTMEKQWLTIEQVKQNQFNRINAIKISAI